MAVNETTVNIIKNEPKVDLVILDNIIRNEFGNNREAMIMIMHAIQREYKFLPEAALRYLSQALGVPLTKIFEIATFYASFSLVQKGEHIFHICTGTACHLRGSYRLVEHTCSKVKLPLSGGTTPDLKITVETVNCLGACSVAPVVVVNEVYHPKADIKLLNEILDDLNI